MGLPEERLRLVDKISYEHFKFKSFSLGERVTLQISEVVRVEFENTQYYVPVTSEETFSIARRFGFFPLTRAIADKIQNKAVFIPRKYMDSNKDIYDFKTYSKYLAEKQYDGITRSGAHKLWLISNRRGIDDPTEKDVLEKGLKTTTTINHGFYDLANNNVIRQDPRVSLDRKYNIVQNIGAKHNRQHWDYSQLLQLMYAPAPLIVRGRSMSLIQALKSGVSLVTDEGAFDDFDLP